ncbi:hypothetical protein AHAS_Ahas12G0201900 [Arachis hypogaea]
MRLCDRSTGPSFCRSCGSCSLPWPRHFHFHNASLLTPLTFELLLVRCSSSFCAARYISGTSRIYGLLALFSLTLDSSLCS